jgi:hypothetical protein
VRTLGLGQGLEPVGNLVEALVACVLGHSRVHVGVLVGLAGDRRLQVVRGRTDRQPGGRVAYLLQVLQVTVGVTGLALGGGTEHRGHVVVAFHVRLGGEVQVTAVGLGFAGKGVLQVLFGLASFEIHRCFLRWVEFAGHPADCRDKYKTPARSAEIVSLDTNNRLLL